jgi:hypothetical protein
MHTRRAACTVLLALAAFAAGCGGDRTDDKPAAKSSPTATVNREGEFITAVQNAELEFTTRHPSNDELLAFPPKWCAELADGHSVAYLFDPIDGSELYPWGDDWGMKEADASELLVIGVKTHCPKQLPTVTEELRANGQY